MGSTSRGDAECNGGRRSAADPELRLIEAIGHPLRAEILALLECEPMPADRLSERLGLPLSQVAHHARVLHFLGFVQSVGAAPAGGSAGTIYSGRARALLDDLEWAGLSDEARSGLARAILAQGTWVEVAEVLAGASDGAQPGD